jgi:hypothetical protein
MIHVFPHQLVIHPSIIRLQAADPIRKVRINRIRVTLRLFIILDKPKHGQ